MCVASVIEKNNQYRNICFASIKATLIKSYHLRMSNRILLWFRKLPQWNHYVNRTVFEWFEVLKVY